MQIRNRELLLKGTEGGNLLPQVLPRLKAHTEKITGTTKAPLGNHIRNNSIVCDGYEVQL